MIIVTAHFVISALLIALLIVLLRVLRTTDREAVLHFLLFITAPIAIAAGLVGVLWCIDTLIQFYGGVK